MNSVISGPDVTSDEEVKKNDYIESGSEQTCWPDNQFSNHFYGPVWVMS
jgi:hypothetical protein